jgi:hypothetical protein
MGKAVGLQIRQAMGVKRVSLCPTVPTVYHPDFNNPALMLLKSGQVAEVVLHHHVPGHHPFLRIHVKEILNNMAVLQVMIWNLAFKLEPSINPEFEVLSNQHPVLCD